MINTKSALSSCSYWLLTTEYPPFFGGGISTYCYLTAKMLNENDYRVTVFLPDFSISDYVKGDEEGIRIIRFNPNRTVYNNALGHVTNISYAFAQIVKEIIALEGKPNFIEAQDYLGIAYYLLQFKYLKYDWCQNIPIIITLHSPAFLYLEFNHVSTFAYPNFWIGEMERFSVKAADVLISPSKYLIEIINARFSFDTEKAIVVPNPFQNYFGAFKKITGSKKEIIFFGKLSPQKGIFKLLVYFDNLWKKGFKEALTLIGSPDILYHPENKTMGDVVKHKYGKYIKDGLLKLEDKIPPNQIPDRLAQAKVVIVPSTVDNFPYVVMEVMSLGQIVLASKQGGQAEIISDEHDGFLFDHNLPDTFYTKLLYILELTDIERLKIENAAKHKIQTKYNFNIIFNQKNIVLKNLTTSKPTQVFPLIRLNIVKPSFIETKAEMEMLSIIIPYYNMGRFIDETIKSIEKADWHNKEIIIINDGSTEINSIQNLEKYRNRSEIKVIDSENKGLGAARNLGASLAKGTFLAFLDADDLVAPEYYSKAIKVLNHYNNLHFIGAWTQYFEDSNKIWPTFNPEPPLILFHNTINSSALVYKKDAFLYAGFNDVNMDFQGLEDYESVISMVSAGFAGAVLPEPLFSYRVRKDSMIREISIPKKILLINYINQKHKHFYSNFAADLLALINANGLGLKLDNPSLDTYLSNKIWGSSLIKKLIPLIKSNKITYKAAYSLFKILKKH